jgi:glyoxylase-like metal-dependent hydrolase (beta-lactamase superfamily II)
VREIVSDIWTWPWFSPRHGYNFNGLFVRHAAGNLCIDPVEPDPETLAEIERLGAARVILTNRNHVRAANVVRARTGARTAIHPDDAGYARGQGAEVDDELRHGEQVGPFITIGVPGKSPGEVALHWPERRILVVGDAVIGTPAGRCALLPEKMIDNPVRLRASVAGLLDVEFDTLLVGDGESILHGARDRVAELVASFLGA